MKKRCVFSFILVLLVLLSVIYAEYPDPVDGYAGEVYTKQELCDMIGKPIGRTCSSSTYPYGPASYDSFGKAPEKCLRKPDGSYGQLR